MWVDCRVLLSKYVTLHIHVYSSFCMYARFDVPFALLVKFSKPHYVIMQSKYTALFQAGWPSSLPCGPATIGLDLRMIFIHCKPHTHLPRQNIHPTTHYRADLPPVTCTCTWYIYMYTIMLKHVFMWEQGHVQVASIYIGNPFQRYIDVCTLCRKGRTSPTPKVVLAHAY